MASVAAHGHRVTLARPLQTSSFQQARPSLSQVSRGLSRLFERDIQRECATESASFLVGYLLGLPCLAFAPTAYKPVEMVADTAGEIAEFTQGALCLGRIASRIPSPLILGLGSTASLLTASANNTHIAFSRSHPLLGPLAC